VALALVAGLSVGLPAAGALFAARLDRMIALNAA